jgi:membrane AbrB-like protein
MPESRAAIWAATWRARLAPQPLGRLALGLAVGAIGGFAAAALGLPLAWMLGPLFLCMAASLARLPIDVPMWMRTNFLFLIGLFLGESFEGLDAQQILRWPVSMAGAVLYLPVATAFAYAYYRHLLRQRAMTALCSSIPGGLIAVVMMSGALGADERNVALAQALRIAFVVCLAPVVAFGLLGYPPPDAATFAGERLMSLPDFALAVAASLALMLLLARTRLPILSMVCPLSPRARCAWPG